MTNTTTLVDVLRQHVLQQPMQDAFIFLKHSIDKETPEERRLNYTNLDKAARGIANFLLRQQASNSLPVLLVFPPGLEFIKAFIGCLYAGVIAVPATPPRRNQSLKRLKSIVANSRAQISLTSESLLTTLQTLIAGHSDLEALQWLTTDHLGINGADDKPQETLPQIDSESIAFLQYTSGSTGDPKAVMVTHSNILHNEQMIQQAFGHGPETRVVGWLPLYHDMGLVGNVLQPLFLGVPSILMSPVEFLQQPYRWLKAISDYRATTSGGPNFAYDLCVRKIPPEKRSCLDLSSWELAFNGAEPIRASTLTAFVEAFAPCGFRKTAFYPCYGMAETTLLVSGGGKHDLPIVCALDRGALKRGEAIASQGNLTDQDTQLIVGCGHPCIEGSVRIVNPETLIGCLDGQVGEIWVAGPHVARGYWQQLEHIEQTFNAYLADTKEGPFLRTGDLGFLQNGELFVTGRIKDVIIIRGRNHYPQDIELTVETSHPALKPGSGAAFSVEINGEERLVIAQEVERNYLRKINVDEVVRAIRKVVSEQHELLIYAVVLLKPGSILKTSSGKIQRQACRASFLEDGLSMVGLWKSDVMESRNELLANPIFPIASNSKDTNESLQNWIEIWLARKLKIDPNEIDLDKSFADYGISSVMAIEFSQDLADWIELPIEATILWNFSTVKALVQHLTTQIQSKKASSLEQQLPDEQNIPLELNLNHHSQEGIEALIDQEISKLEKVLERGK